MQQKSIYKISGVERRKKKRELFELERFVRDFWRYEDVDRIYGGGLSNSECRKILREKKKKIRKRKRELKKKV